ncbi:hypothetical protein BDW71DRAFT_48460 [Aspergillus fruticulosus]
MERALAAVSLSPTHRAHLETFPRSNANVAEVRTSLRSSTTLTDFGVYCEHLFRYSSVSSTVIPRLESRARVSREVMIKLPDLRRSFPWLKASDLKHEGTSGWRIRRLISDQDLQRLPQFLQRTSLRLYDGVILSHSALLTENRDITKRPRSKLTT